MRTIKNGLLLLLVASHPFCNASDRSVTMVKTTQSGEPKALEAKTSYEELIKPPSSKATARQKNNQIQQLEMLSALVTEQALVRIKNILLDQLGKESDDFKNANTRLLGLKDSLDEFIPSDALKIPKNVLAAFEWAIGRAKDSGSETFVRRGQHTDEIKNMYMREGKKIPNAHLKRLLDDELAVLNERYAPIVKRLKTMKPTTILFDDITLLDSIYINALQ